MRARGCGTQRPRNAGPDILRPVDAIAFPGRRLAVKAQQADVIGLRQAQQIGDGMRAFPLRSSRLILSCAARSKRLAPDV
jgi:hypothetical protein